jgi:hypothetical protein
MWLSASKTGKSTTVLGMAMATSVISSNGLLPAADFRELARGWPDAVRA